MEHPPETAGRSGAGSMHRQDVHIEHMPAVAPAHAGSAVELRADDQERINRALRDARAPNTWRAYRGAWQRSAAWAVDRGHRHLPADPAAVAAFLADRAEQGAAPATVRLDRAGIAAMDWRAADLAAVLAEREGTAAGLRDAALLSLMSDALLRVSEASAADVADVARMADGSGTLTCSAARPTRRATSAISAPPPSPGWPPGSIAPDTMPAHCPAAFGEATIRRRRVSARSR